MKTTKGVILGMVILTIVSCSKKPCPSPDISNVSTAHSDQISLSQEAVNQKNYKFNTEVKLFDETKEFFVTYKISSNNKDVVEGMESRLQGLTIIMKDGVTKLDPVSPSKQEVESPMPYDFENGIHFTEIERQIGSHKGYAVSIPNQNTVNSRSAGVNVNSYANITVTVYGCAGLYTRNLWVYTNYNFHYYDNLGWQFESMVPLGLNEQNWFRLGGYGNHQLVISPSNINPNWAYNNYIYWEAL